MQLLTLSTPESMLVSGTINSDPSSSFPKTDLPLLYDNQQITSTSLFQNKTGSSQDVQHGGEEFDLFFVILLSVILGLMILTTVIGNVFVMAAILMDRHLQSVANYLILSLAVADLLVALLVMPLGAVKEISKKWILGPILCDMWTCSDVLCCTASILHLLAIAIDRYWAVTHPHYIHSRSSSVIWVLISLVWVMSIIVSLAPLFGWKDDKWSERVEQGECLVSQDLYYQIFATASTFFVPLILILLLYWKIFLTARTRLRNRLAQKTKLPQASVIHTATLAAVAIKHKNLRVSQNISGNLETSTTSFSANSVSNQDIGNGVSNLSPIPTPSEDSSSSDKPTDDHVPSTTHVPHGCPRHKNGHIQHNNMACQTEPNFNSQQAEKLEQQQRQERLKRKKEKKHVSLEAKREKKAAKTLAIVTGAFIVCWLPFFIMALVAPLCEGCINNYVFSFFLWLGYFNSTLNPIIYTVFSPEFRQAFKKLLCGRASPNNYRPRHLQ